MAYEGAYAQQPTAQGPQGPAGASQKPKPNINAQQYRASQWSPAPSSAGQAPGQRQSSAPQQQQQTDQMAGNPGSPVMSNGMINPQSGGGGMMQQSTATPQQIQQNSASNLNRVVQGQYGGDQNAYFAAAQQMNAAPGGVMTASSANRNQGPGLLDAGAQQPQGQDPFASMGGGVMLPGGQWVPRNHPLATQGGAPGQPATPTGAQPNPALYSPYGPYPGRPEGTVYQPGQLPQFNFANYQTAQFNQQAPGAYQPGQVNQFNAPNFGSQEDAQWQAIQHVLNNPGLGDTTGLKEQQKEAALQMQRDALQNNANNAAAFGRSSLAGTAGANQRRIGDATQGNILGSYRDIDIANAERANADRLAAAGMAGQAINDRAGRAQNFYQTGLAGQLAQEDLNLQGFNSRMQGAEFNANQQARQADENARGFEAQFKGPQFQLESMLKQEGLNQAGAQSGLDAYNTDMAAFNTWRDDLARNRQLDLQGQLGNRGLDLDQSRLTQQGSQFDRGLQLDWASLMNNAYLGRAGLGLQTAQLQQNGQNSMQDFIAQMMNR